jgi:Na+/H+ antiporter NhaD/arsenite permease-like protein
MVIAAIIFVLGYMLIAFEHQVKIDKAATALVLGVVVWLTVAFGMGEISDTVHHLTGHFEEIAEILFFLLSAMTIVELIDTHNGFEFVQRIIVTRNKASLLWILCILTFFLSAVLDNLTTTIVMMAILKKFMDNREDSWFFAGFIIIAANAGGAWSPIGDVTTIMLWNGGQVSTGAIVVDTFLPSLACMLVPLAVASYRYRGQRLNVVLDANPEHRKISAGESNLMLFIGVGLLLLVPVFKTVTHLPPFMGMLFSLGLFWVITELWHRKKAPELKHHLSVSSTLQRIDTTSVLFFLGILLAVAAMETNGSLHELGMALDVTFANYHVTNTLLGLLSSVVDNVPLVAGAMGMYSMERFPQDHEFWTFLAYCAGTGGSVLIIGSAAGVAAMGIMRIEFMWFLKRISWLALLGYFAGIGVYLLQNGGGI